MQSGMHEMPSVDEAEEVFFDADDQLMSEESVVKSDFFCRKFEYDIWLRKPQSVKERREIFLCRMGFVEVSSYGEFEAMERTIESSEAMSGESSSSATVDDSLLCERRLSNSEANSSFDYYDQDWLDDICIRGDPKVCEISEKAMTCSGESPNKEEKTKKIVRWWRHFTEKMKSQRFQTSLKPRIFHSPGMMTLVKTEYNRKRCIECSAVYSVQQITAHNGLIWTMKFSPDGQYLASGGKDGVVCIFRVSKAGSSCKSVKCSLDGQELEGKANKNLASRASTVIPKKIFHIEEQPVQKFKGHDGEVLDLAWSSSNHLLSASTDKTVRLWQVGLDKYLGVFRHWNYVTCVQFNPVDENYFISGSIDGKIRVWNVLKKRVEDWANVQDLVTAICYQPNGKGFVVGSFSGICQFFETSGDELLLKAAINFQGKKKSGNKITGIQFLKNDSQRVMITSEDSRIRILDGLDVVRKYRGLVKSGCQMSASFTSNGRHIVSVGDDSRLYVWNYDDPYFHKSKQAKSIRSCEHFLIEGVSVAIPWTDLDTEWNSFTCSSSRSIVSMHDHLDSSSRTWDSQRFSLASWFSMDGSFRSSLTWPEEKLPIWDSLSSENDCQLCNEYGDRRKMKTFSSRIASATWGLVLVTAGRDGTIRTFHNYGFPVRT